jgi:hypothetical protein
MTIAGELPHDWLQANVAYYEEIEIDYRAKDQQLQDLKKAIRLWPDRIQCHEMRKALPSCLGWDCFIEHWRPGDLILTSRQKVREWAQLLLFDLHKHAFPNKAVFLQLYCPKDTHRQNRRVTISGPLLQNGQPDQQELILNDVVEVTVQTVQEVLEGKWGPDWALGYAMTMHSSQGLTIRDPQKVRIIDDILQWSNLAYLVVSRVEYLHQLERVVCPQMKILMRQPSSQSSSSGRPSSRNSLPTSTRTMPGGLAASTSRLIIIILALQDAQSNKCAACNIELLWAYQPKDTQHFKFIIHVHKDTK